MRAEDLKFIDFYSEISQDWQKKSEELQARRWHKMNEKRHDNGHRVRRPISDDQFIKY
jgi:hypothetical protein